MYLLGVLAGVKTSLRKNYIKAPAISRRKVYKFELIEGEVCSNFIYTSESRNNEYSNIARKVRSENEKIHYGKTRGKLGVANLILFLAEPHRKTNRYFDCECCCTSFIIYRRLYSSKTIIVSEYIR